MLFVSTALLVLAAAPQWKDRGTVDGIQIELRDVEGSHFEEIRLTTVSDQPLERLCEVIFGKGAAEKNEGNFKKREVIKETDTDRWTYEQIALPVVSDRDYVVHVKLDQPASSGRCEVSFQTEDDATRPSPAGFVRLAAVRGRWWVTPHDAGKVKVVYQVFSDPGGSVPPLFVWGGARQAAIDFLKTILKRAKSPSSGR